MTFFLYAYWHSARFKNKSGGPIKVYELATNLKQSGNTVFLFIPKIGYPERQTSAEVIAIPFVDFPVLRFISFQVFAFLISLFIIIKKGRPNIIYVRIMWSFLPMLLGKFFHIPVLLEVNDSPHRGYAGINNSCKKRLVHLIDRISYRLSAHIIPVTNQIAQDLHNIEGVLLEVMTVVPSGTNTELFHPLDKLSCCQKLNFDFRKKYVGFIGSFFPFHDIGVIIDSAPLILKKFPDVLFLLVGDGPMRKIWQDKVTQTGVEDYFIFTGHVPYDDVPSYCGVMDLCICLFLKEARESSAVKIFDYLACAKPVVITDVSNTGSDFLKSEAVVLVKPEDSVDLARAINSLLRNHNKSQAMGKKGRQFVVSEYDRKDIAKIIEDIAYRLSQRRYST
jgi:glycosyltransferase involved in cell wall biosynthesis